MSELGKIRAGSPRVYRDRIVGRRGAIVRLGARRSADGLSRYVFHPDDIAPLTADIFGDRIARLYPDSSPSVAKIVNDMMVSLIVPDYEEGWPVGEGEQ